MVALEKLEKCQKVIVALKQQLNKHQENEVVEKVILEKKIQLEEKE